MSTIFRLDSSIRREGSVSRAVASTLQSALVAGLGDTTVIHREIGLTPLPSNTWSAIVSTHGVPADQWTVEQKEASALGAELEREMINADALILAVPLYNFGVSQHFKTWVDIMITQATFSPYAVKPGAGRPAYLVLTRGGGYGPGTPREGWDHSTGWVKRIFEDVWGFDVNVIETELTLAETNPAMYSLREIASKNLEDAHNAANNHGKRLAEKLGVIVAA